MTEKEEKETLLARAPGMEQDQEDSCCLWCPQMWFQCPDAAVGSTQVNKVCHSGS